MLTDDILQKALRWASALQPAREVAIRVLIDACLAAHALGDLQARRPGANRPSKLRFSEENLLQRGVYLASEAWEKDQESSRPKRRPLHSPTADDMLTRYVKTLAMCAMGLRLPRHAAVAVGGLLYTFPPRDISALSEDFFGSDNIRRDMCGMRRRVKTRFPSLRTDAAGQIVLAAPCERERALILESLSALAPSCECRTATAQSPHDAPLIVTYFGHDSEKTDLERVHALFDPTCCGLARLVREYNSYCTEGSGVVLDDPEDKLGAPEFDGFERPGGGDGGGRPPDWRARFNPLPLTDAEMSSVRHAVELNQGRRSRHRGGELRVYVDGVETEDFTTDYVFYMFPSPDVARTASCIEVFGEDEEKEEVLLAVFPLHFLEPDDEGLGQSLCVTLDGGRSIELSVAPVEGRGREPSESVVRLKCAGTIGEGSEPGAGEEPARAQDRPAGWPPGDLAAAFVAGDGPHHKFWGTTLEQFYSRLKSYALAVARGRTYDAEDLLQETCYRVFRYARGPESVRSPLGYLLTVMRNVWLDKAIRQSAARVESLDDLLDGGRHPPVEPQVLRLLESRELKAELAARCGRLTPREKLLLGLHLRGYEPKEIADRLGEDVRLTRADLNAVRAKVRYRLAAANRKKG